jgi:hypothetical protein
MIEIKFPCPHCGQKIACDETASGRTVNCPLCQTASIVPDAREWQSLQPQDVYLIYRGENGDAAELAQLVRDGLRKRRFEVCVNSPDHEGGRINLINLKKIELADDILVICTPGCFDRCQNDLDRKRVEIRLALQLKKNVVPFFERHFTTPLNPLPEDISAVLIYNGVRPDMTLWEESMNLLTSDRLLSRTKAQARQTRLKLAKARPLALFAGVVALLGMGIGLACLPQLSFLAQSKYYHNPWLVTQMAVGFMFGLNLLILIAAGLAYGLKVWGLKLLNSAASGLMLSNLGCSLAYILIIRTGRFSDLSAMHGAPVLATMVTALPLIAVIQWTRKLLH